MVEKSLVLIKPDAVEKNLIGKIINHYESEGLKVIALKMEMITGEFAGSHYAEHKGKGFYDSLIEFIIRSPLCALVLEGDNVIQKVRKINGATNPEKAEEGTIRKLYASSNQENCVHASDCQESAIREISLWFPNLE
ncbi:MAG: nucleoside-diphosphate kinase [Clostridium sp.]